MKTKNILAAAVAVTVFAAPVLGAEIHTIDRTHSDVSFQVRHLLSSVRGEFNDFSGTILFDKGNVTNSSVEFTVQAESIDTDNPDRDKHLRSQDFFWVEEYPTLAFTSTAVEAVDEDTFKVTGNLTIRGVTRPVELMVDYLGEVKDPWGNVKAGFSTSTVLDRKVYGLEWNKALEAGGFLLGDDVTVSIELETGVKGNG